MHLLPEWGRLCGAHICCCLWPAYLPGRRYHISRVRSAYSRPVNRRTVHAHPVPAYRCCTRPVPLCYMEHLHRLVCHLLYRICPRPVIISHMRTIIHVHIVNVGSLAYVPPVICGASPVMNTIRAIHILRPNKYPPALRAVISRVHTYTRP